jgi:cyclophilin family peptidyl-prolyl cis-trans isomerase
MVRNKLAFCFALVFVVATLPRSWAAAQETPAEPITPGQERTPNELTRDEKAPVAGDQPQDPKALAAANAAFQEKFNEFKTALRDIEKLRAEYQAANEADRKKLNEKLAAAGAHTQSIVNAMVETAMEAYRLAPNADPQVTEVLVAVAKHYAIGRQSGPGESNRQNPDDPYYPIDGGDQYELALPIIKLLIDNGATEKQLFVWGFLSAFMTNDYPLAKEYLKKAGESGALEDLMKSSQKSAQESPEGGLTQVVAHLVTTSAGSLEEYEQLWEKEKAIRDAEAKADDLPRVKLTTSKGEITIELFENEAPQSVANFLTLVKDGFYDGVTFHRVLPKFMAQGGDPTGEGSGGPGYSIRGEASVPNHRKHFRGTLSMAHSGHPDSGGSQFFLTFVPTPHLNGRHTAFGRVVEGIEVLSDLQRRSAQHQQNPAPADRIIKAEVVRDRGHEYKFDKLPER